MTEELWHLSQESGTCLPGLVATADSRSSSQMVLGHSFVFTCHIFCFLAPGLQQRKYRWEIGSRGLSGGPPPVHLRGSPPEEKPAPSIREVNWPATDGQPMFERVRRARGLRGSRQMPGVTTLICWSAIPLPVKSLSVGQPADRCALEEAGAARLLPLGCLPWLLPPSRFPRAPLHC